MGALSIDLYLPAFGSIAENLGTNINEISYSLSSFFIGLAVGQLLYGPLLERFGRKRPIYVGMFLYIVASGGCALAQSVEALIVFRFFQALGGCAGMVSSRAIVRDMFDGKDIARMFSTLMMVVAVSPILGPSIGGVLSTSLGWRSVFVVLVLLGAGILLGARIILPETREPDPEFSLRPRVITGKFLEILRHPVFMVNALTGGLIYAGLYAYLSGSPHLYMELLGVSEQAFGGIFAIIAVGIISATQINNLVLKRLISKRIILLALLALSGVSVIFLSVTLLGQVGIVLDTVLIFSYLFFMGFVFPNASALSLQPMGKVAGSASALMGALQMTIGAGVSALVGLFQGEGTLSMVMAMSLCAFGSLALFYYGHRWIQQHASVEEEMG